MLDFPFLIERSYCLIKLLVQVQFFSVWNTKWHIVTLLKKHTIVSFHDLSHVSQGSFSQPSSPWLAQAALIDKSWREKFFKIMAGSLLHITMRNFFPKVEYFAIWHRHLLHSANKQRRSGHATYVHMN